MRQGASETTLTTIVTSMMTAAKPVEMSVDGFVNSYRNQQSLRGSLKQQEVRSKLKQNVSNKAPVAASDAAAATGFDPSRSSQNMMLQFQKFEPSKARAAIIE